MNRHLRRAIRAKVKRDDETGERRINTALAFVIGAAFLALVVAAILGQPL
jgi:hypothetical protein